MERKDDGCSALVPFVAQETHHDCGRTCVLMICRFFKVDVDRKQLADSVGSQCLWSIELALALHHAGLAVSMNTALAGVSSEHASKPFYRDDYDEDADRIPKVFAQAKKLGIAVHERSLSASEFRQLAASNILMVLIESTPGCERCVLENEASDSDGSASSDGEQPDESDSRFAGHFVVVHGLTASGAYRVVDPSAGHDLCEWSAAQMESARKADGTDEDILVISGLRPSPAGSSSAVSDQEVAALKRKLARFAQSGAAATPGPWSSGGGSGAGAGGAVENKAASSKPG